MSLKESIKNFFSGKDVFTNFFAFYVYTTALVVAFYIVIHPVPPANERIADVFFGTIIGAAIVTVINYKFGSSASSKDKDNTIKGMMDNNKSNGQPTDAGK